MRRRDIPIALWASAAAPAAPVHGGQPTTPATDAEHKARVGPADPNIPSHLVTGHVYPQRYGAKFDGATDDTAALNNAFRVANEAQAEIVMPGGVAMVSNLQFGSNATSGQSRAPPGLRGQGAQTTLKALPRTKGTVLSAQGLSGIFLRDFTVDANHTAAVCIDTSWPNTIGPSAQNTYLNVWAQNFNKCGWLAINDNQSSFKDIVVRYAANYGLSGIRIEGSGGAIYLDNVTVADSFLSICCQNADIRGGFSFGIRLNESQNGVNFLSFSGGTQVYCNPTTLSHFEDANHRMKGHYITALVANGIYLISSPDNRETNTINCGVVSKISFHNCAFITQTGATGPWRLYGPRAYNANSPYPSIVELNGTSEGVLNTETPTGFITQRRDVNIASVGLLSDYPMRVVYRNTATFPSGLSADSYTALIPAAAMAETGATYLVCISANLNGIGRVPLTTIVNCTERSGAIAPSDRIGAVAGARNSPEILLRYGEPVQVGAGSFAGLEFAVKNGVPPGSNLSVLLIRLGNPLVNY